MPLYKYAYANNLGDLLTDEVVARDIREAALKVRMRMKETRDFVLWDRDDPPHRVLAWLGEWLERS